MEFFQIYFLRKIQVIRPENTRSDKTCTQFDLFQ